MPFSSRRSGRPPSGNPWTQVLQVLRDRCSWIAANVRRASSGAIMPLASHSLSAFVPHDLEAPIAGAATGPLAGLTGAVKDMYDIAGYRTGGGSPDWLAAAAPATSSAAAVRKIVDAGATVIGKTICDEFFFSVTGANAHYG